jgi:RNA polymerase sigma-70 factor (ECF subfamily)
VASDEELIAAWRGGDTRAGEQFVQRMFEPIRRFFASKVGGEVEELLQQTFAAIVVGKDRFEGRASPRAYVFGVARNILREHYRGRSRAGVDIEESSVRDLGAGPSTMRWRRKEDERLLDALRSLPLHMQTVIELFYWDDLTGREVAEILEVPEGTVASRLRRARARLRSALDGGSAVDDGETEDAADDETLDVWSERVRAAVRPVSDA